MLTICKPDDDYADAPPTKEFKMKIGFFFWPFNIEMTETMARHADTYGYDMIGIADTAGNAMDPPGSRRPSSRG